MTMKEWQNEMSPVSCNSSGGELLSLKKLAEEKVFG